MSKLRSNPFINFNGRAREAMEHYNAVLGGDLVLETMGEDWRVRAAGPGDRISNARLDADGAVIVATDGHPDHPAEIGTGMAIALASTDAGRIARAFDGLADGGRVQMALTPQPSGGQAGWLVDRFGVHWTLVVEPS
jgi:PhnB protein